MKRLIIPSNLVPIVLVLLIGITTANAQRTPALARYRASAVQVNDPAPPQSGASTALSTGYDLSWYNIDGGSATFSIGGSYSRMVMVGQPDAGSMGGGSYTINGGFWGNALIDDNHYLPLALENF